MPDRMIPIALLQFNADKSALKFRGDVAFRADPHEGAENHVAGIAPQDDGSLDEAELQRAKMALILGFLGHANVERIGLIYVHPDRRSPLLPLCNREFGRFLA